MEPAEIITGDPTGQVTQPTGSVSDPAEPKQTGVTFSQEQQDYLNSLLKKERTEAKKQAQKEFDAAQQKGKEDAEAERLKQQNEWQKLAETHEGAVKELTPKVETLTAQVTAYEAVIVELLEAKIKALGDGAKTAVNALPGSPDSLAKLQWLNANEALFKAAVLGPGNQTKTKPGAPLPQSPQGAQQMTPARPIVRL